MNEMMQESVLVVDDSPDIIDVLGRILRPYYRVKFALSGPQALALVQKYPPNLILLDVLMPGMNGHEVCRALKSDPHSRHIPVIFLTGSIDARDEQHGLELGAVDYLHKPPNPALVLQRVRIHLALHNQNLALEARVQERTLQLREEIAERKRAEAALQRFNRALRTITRCNEVLVRATRERELLQEMCRTIVEIGQHPLAWVGFAENDDAKSVRLVARFGSDGEFLDHAAITWADSERGQGLTGTAIRTGAVQANLDFATDSRLVPWRSAALKSGFKSGVALPLADESGIFGSLTIYSREGDAFDPQELKLLANLASDLAFGINALRIREDRDRAVKDLQLAATVFEESPDGILITDAGGNILAVNRSFTTILGYPEAEVLGKNPRLLGSDRHDASFYVKLWTSIKQTDSWMGEIWNRRKNGEVFPGLESITAIRDKQGMLTHYLGILTDISKRKESEERIRYLTQHDALTGLPNRSLFTDRLEQAIIHASRTKRLVSVIHLNIDRFKQINDSLGHAAGDGLLRQVANSLAGCLRPGDTVARLGGDEFVLMASDVASENDAASLARKLLSLVATPLLLDGQEVVVTASLGVAMSPRDGELAAVLLQNADAAMHRAKERGCNNVQFYASTMNARMLERFELESSLRRAIECQAFFLVYQPKVDLARGHIVGVEALIRWQHPVRGMVSPADFVPLAEETGLIIPMGEWLIETACQQIKTWQDEGFSDLCLSINLSARQFQQENLVELVAQALRNNNVPAQSLELEITESAVMQDPERTIALLQRLKAIGVSISLDDFGTGYSSLNYLKRFPIDVLKIDQSFIRDVTSDPQDAAIACAVISLAHILKLEVIAEGVETEAQLSFLQRHRCDQIQGYLFSGPLPAEDFLQFLRDGKTLNLGRGREESTGRTLLILDDEESILASLKRLLRRDGYRILTTSSAAQAFELLALNEVQVIIADQRMPEMSGTAFLSRVKDMYPDTMRLVLSGYTELQSIADAINHGAIYKFLTKPWDDQVLREQIREAFLFQELKRDELQQRIRTQSNAVERVI